MFNSNLPSSISGWFSDTFQSKDEPNKDDKNEDIKEKSSNTNINEEPSSEKTETETETEKSIETNHPDKTAEESSDKESSVLEMNSEQVQKKIMEETQKVMTSAKNFGSYLFGVATEASKKVSSTVNETATTLKKTVEDKTILGDLNREQNDFIRKKREKQGGDAVPPWYGYHEEETMKQQILALSNDARNFLRSPPSGVQFQFDFDQMLPIAMATLKEDENLRKMRFKLVPTKIKEETFWKNYFYRVSLIKQSAQLSSLTEMQRSCGDVASSESSASSIVLVGNSAVGATPSRDNGAKSLDKNESDTSLSLASQSRTKNTSPDLSEAAEDLPNAEFASDAFDPSLLNPDDLEREMKELGMDENIPEWEHELQKELQDYEVVNGKKDEAWEEELDSMLTSEAQSS